VPDPRPHRRGLPAAPPDKIAVSGIRAVSISLDGARPDTHEGVRGIAGHFAATVDAIRALAHAGLAVQVNTTVMPANAAELADIAELTVTSGARIWEVSSSSRSAAAPGKTLSRRASMRNLPLPL
jgi:AdoMet-dependent heme synthase